VLSILGYEDQPLKPANTDHLYKGDQELCKKIRKGQSVEVQVKNVVILGAADPETYPIQPKKPPLDSSGKAHS
jgi:asparaginyl-tRNA synthetase